MRNYPDLSVYRAAHIWASPPMDPDVWDRCLTLEYVEMRPGYFSRLNSFQSSEFWAPYGDIQSFVVFSLRFCCLLLSGNIIPFSTYRMTCASCSLLFCENGDKISNSSVKNGQVTLLERV